ncbi:MAG: EAL domain-containing protein [Pseudomonadota bacterium]
MSLHRKILLLFLALLLSSMGLLMVLMTQATRDYIRAQIGQQLSIAQNVLSNELQARRLAQDAMTELIANDAGLQAELSALQAGDDSAEPTLLAVLKAFVERSQVDFVLITAANGRILAGTSARMPSGQPLPWSSLLARDDPQRNERLILHEGRGLYLVATPLLDHQRVLRGWLVTAVVLDDAMATRMARLTGTDVVLLMGMPGAYRVLASNLSVLPRAEFSAQGLSQTLFELQLQEHPQLAQPMPVASGALQVLLLRPLSASTYRSLYWQLAGLLVVALLLAGFGAWWIANSVSRPLTRMVANARRIAQGDYQTPMQTEAAGELGLLAREFAQMQQGIAEREATIGRLAYRDPLTALANRNRFVEQLQQALDQAAPEDCVAVLLMDLDNFKDFNDTLGHTAGDQLLRQLADRLQRALAPGEQLARLGGDEFVLLLPQANAGTAIRAAQRLRGLLSEPFEARGIQLTLYATLGIALSPEHGESAGRLLQHAEVAMYQGKAQHLPYAFYRSELDHHSLVRLALMSELHGAIKAGQLSLYYQPKLEIATNALFAIECLVRWQHPLHGLVAPDDFIPLAEKTGHICALTRWAVRTALGQGRVWQTEGLQLRICINISALDLADQRFAKYVADTLAEQAVAPQTLILEITESALMADSKLAVRQLEQLRRLGVMLSIDDFGTGHSSMAQLKRLPVHELKIDRSFVQDLINNRDDAIIVRSTIELAHNMDLKVVAEGVESLEILERLSELGCDIAQGFALSPPLHPDAFAAWLRTTTWALPLQPC